MCILELFVTYLLTYTELLWLSVLKISVLSDIQDSDDCDGYDSTVLLDHIRGTDDGSFQSLLLEEVDLHGNHLTSLPSWLFVRFAFLRRVDASHNQLKHLPFAIWACTSLVELNLSSNCLSSLSCSQIESVQLQLDGDVDLRPGTPASITSETSLPSDITTVLSSTDTDHRSVDVRHLERWRDRLNVRPVTYLGDFSARSSQIDNRKSRLKELDLSHNEFEEVPSLLSCIAPFLERLNLSHNRLTRFGAIECYPASLRLLDLSHNQIFVMDLTEDCHNITSPMTLPMSVPSPSLLSSRSRLCCSPFPLKRSVVFDVFVDVFFWASVH